MTENERWRLWVGIYVAVGALTMLMLIGALASGSRTAVIFVIGFTPVAGVGTFALLVWAKNRSGGVTPTYMRGLDPQQRRIVAATANSAVRASDPQLVPAVAAYARRQLRTWLVLLGSSALTVAIRAPHLLSGDEGAWGLVDTLFIGTWLVTAAFLVRSALRARRAIVANRGGDWSPGLT